MKEFPDKYFDLAIVDPPYGDALQNRGGVEPVRAKVRKVPEDICNEKMSDKRTARGVIRTGGRWAAKYAKKLSRGTLPLEKSILTNFSASHGTRLSGGGITSRCRRHAVLWFGVRQISRKSFQWPCASTRGRRLTIMRKCFLFLLQGKRDDFIRHRNQCSYTSGYLRNTQNPGTRYLTLTREARQV